MTRSDLEQIGKRSWDTGMADQPFLDSQNPAMILLLEAARKAASGDSTILISGATGTGKTVLARQIHKWSRRYREPFVLVNCPTVFYRMVETELFGAPVQPPPSATRLQKDLEQACKGTLLLREISELPPALQARVLGVVESRSLEDSTSHTAGASDFRILVTTNRDLEAEISKGRFRGDLYYRLNVINLYVPPLRNRREDILALAEWILDRSPIANQKRLKLSDEAARAFTLYSWPGNVRELRNAIEQATAFASGEYLLLEHLPQAIYHMDSRRSPLGSSETNLHAIEREHILRVIGQSVTLSEAAAKLGIAETTLWRKRRRYKNSADYKV